MCLIPKHFSRKKKMNYTLMSSLEHRALIRIDIALVIKFYCELLMFNDGHIEWQVVENKVIEKISMLVLPESLKKKVLYFIKPIGFELLKWKEYHENLLCDRRFIMGRLNSLCWTSRGTIDRKKTAEILIKDESLDIVKRYNIACIYCLENDIQMLWNKIPENRTKYFNNEHSRKVEQEMLISLWTFDLKEEISKLDNMSIKCYPSFRSVPLEFAFVYAAGGGNKAATEYFLQKLLENRELHLVRAAKHVLQRKCDFACNGIDPPKEYYADVLCFLLSQMDEGQQVEIFKSCPYGVLKCFLDWPWQSFFMETANRMLTFLPKENYFFLLQNIVNKIMTGYKDYNYQKLFGEFWQQGPNTLKKYVIDECSSRSLLSKLFRVEDIGNIKLILKNATTIEKKKIISSDAGINTCEYLIYGDKWDFLKFFIQECISSKDIMIKFKEEFKERVIHRCSEETLEKEKDMWSKFFQLLDELIWECDKRKCVGEDYHPAKKLCR